MGFRKLRMCSHLGLGPFLRLLAHVDPARGSRFKLGGEAGHNPTLEFYP